MVGNVGETERINIEKAQSGRERNRIAQHRDQWPSSDALLQRPQPHQCNYGGYWKQVLPPYLGIDFQPGINEIRGDGHSSFPT